MIRQDLDKSYQAVQAGHAVAQFILDFPGEWKNEYLIYVGVKDVDDLYKWANIISEKDKKYSMFLEPDIGNEPTALAVHDNGKMFKKLRLI